MDHANSANGVGFLLLIVFVYFIPWVIAGVRRHRSAMAIGAANLFFGWTLAGWAVCFVWSLTGNVHHDHH